MADSSRRFEQAWTVPRVTRVTPVSNRCSGPLRVWSLAGIPWISLRPLQKAAQLHVLRDRGFVASARRLWSLAFDRMHLPVRIVSAVRGPVSVWASAASKHLAFRHPLVWARLR